MTREEMKELYVLQELIENTADGGGNFLYTDYLERGNIRIVRGTKSKSERINLMLPDNPEFNELDWWILFAVTVLRLADSESIYRYLCAEKKKHPELLYSVDDKRVIKRKINKLAHWGFLMRFSYVARTNVDITDAEEKWKAERYVLENTKKDLVKAQQAISVDDEFLDEESEDEISYVDYDAKGYQQELIQDNHLYHGRRAGSETFANSGSFVPHYYGKQAKLVSLYCLEEDSYYWLKNRFGSCLPSFKCPNVQLSYMQVGAAATAQAFSYLCSIPSYRGVCTCKVVSKFNGTFVIPGEVEFVQKLPDGGTFQYKCGLFTDYYFPGKGRLLPSQTERNLMDTFYQIKNYIGINSYKGSGSANRDCFVLVVVNDMLDISKFLFKLLKNPHFVSDAEIDRIYFTGEGILNSQFGINRVLGFRRDDSEEEGYRLFPAKLPVI